jgi:hypothetical protein
VFITAKIIHIHQIIIIKKYHLVGGGMNICDTYNLCPSLSSTLGIHPG